MSLGLGALDCVCSHASFSCFFVAVRRIFSTRYHCPAFDCRSMCETAKSLFQYLRFAAASASSCRSISAAITLRAREVASIRFRLALLSALHAAREDLSSGIERTSGRRIATVRTIVPLIPRAHIARRREPALPCELCELALARAELALPDSLFLRSEADAFVREESCSCIDSSISS